MFKRLGVDRHDGLFWFKESLFIMRGSERESCLNWAHEEAHGFHVGKEDTLATLQSQYDWPGAHDSVERYVDGCHHCQRNQRPADWVDPILDRRPLDPPRRPYSSVILMRIRHLPEAQGMTSVIAALDRYTHFTLFLAASDNESRGVFKWLRDRIYVCLPRPVEFIIEGVDTSDAVGWREIPQFAETMTIALRGRRDSDHETEKLTRALKCYIHSFANQYRERWPKHLTIAEHHLQCNPWRGEALRPYTRLEEAIRDHQGARMFLNQWRRRQPSESARRRSNGLQRVLNLVLEGLDSEVTRRDSVLPRFSTGDQVFVSTRFSAPHGSWSTPAQHWMGPLGVLGKYSRYAYIISVPWAPERGHVVHAALLKRCPPEHFRFREQVPCEVEGTQELYYELLEVLGERERGREILTRWACLRGECWTPTRGLERTIAYQAYRKSRRPHDYYDETH